jgi:23S rRNA pseudouridine1911/1915/1917 synthase
MPAIPTTMRKEIEVTAEESENGLAIKTVLSKSVGLSRREISRLKFTHGLLLNGKEARVTETVHTGDVMTLIFPEKDTPHALRILGKPDILYEDEDIVLVNKPAGMVCHPSHEHLHDDMGSLLQSYYGDGFTIRAVGRLDMDVSGVMCYAKNQPTAARLTKQRSQEILHKTYLAVAEGVFEKKQDRITYSLSRVEGMRSRQVREDGKPCITDYEVLKQGEDRALVKISIITGRTHQIRAGMSHIGHPLCGDALYGGSPVYIDRPALHCAYLDLVQPFTKQRIHVEAPLPEDFEKAAGFAEWTGHTI